MSAATAVAQPQLVRCLSGEVPVHEVITDRRPDLRLPCRAWASSRSVRTSHVSSRSATRSVCAIGLARVAGLVGQKPVPEFRVIAVRVEQGIRPVRLGQLGLGLPGWPATGNTAGVQA